MTTSAVRRRTVLFALFQLGLILGSLRALLGPVSAMAQGPVLNVNLLGKQYDVFRIRAEVAKTKALNNGSPYDLGGILPELVSVSAVDLSVSFYKQAGLYGPHSGTSFLHTNVDVHPEFESFAEDINDANVVIGWDRGGPPRAFIWRGFAQLHYLDDLFPQVKALSEVTIEGSTNRYGTMGLRINGKGDMLISGPPHSPWSRDIYYLVSSNGVVAPLPLDRSQGIDLNNRGEVPPAGSAVSVNLVINDHGDFAGVRLDPGSTNFFDNPNSTEVSATRNGAILADAHGAKPTSINRFGYVGARPGIIWAPDGTRTDVRQVLATQDTNHVLTGFFPGGTNTAYDVFINDNGDIVLGNSFYLIPACPDVSVSAGGGSGIEIINGRFAVRVGGRFKASVFVGNDGKVPLNNISVDLAPASDLLRQISGPNPPLPSSLAPGQSFTSQYEWEVLRPGEFTGAFYFHALSYCGPISIRAAGTRALLFVQSPLTVSVDAPTSVGLSDQIEVRVKAVNTSTQQVTNVKLSAPMSVTGDGGVRLESGPLPLIVPTLAVGESTYFTNVYTATNLGKVVFSTRVQAQQGSQSVDSPIAYSPDVRIGGAADLLVKQSSDPANAYLLNDRYFDLPSEHQLVTAQVQTNQPGDFDVRIDNDSKVTRTLRLAGTATGASNWNNTITFNGQDVSAVVLSANGLVFPNVESNGVRQVRVRAALKPTVTNQADQRITLMLSADDLPGRILDLAQLRSLSGSIPVVASLARFTARGLTPESIEAGRTAVDAPLVPVVNPFLLAEQPLVHAGLVADGVTPLLIVLNGDKRKLAGVLNGRAYQLSLTLVEGTILGPSLQQRLRVLQGNSWVETNVVTLTGEQPDAYAYLPAIAADDVLVSTALKEVKVTLKVVESETGVEVGTKIFGIRQPPLFLIHGYNTGGDWGLDALSIFGRTREYGTFLQIIRYGQERYQGANALSRKAGTDLVNTYYSLNDLVPIALEAFNEAKLKLDTDWAFIRHDVAAHSQGGLLTRMLSSQNPNAWMPQPFRNQENFYRGRFHRVVTIGSPHNGTRLLRYLLSLLSSIRELPDSDLDEVKDGFQVLPHLVGLLMVQSGTAQDKFDPFGPQIRQLNDPAPDAPWRPDPAARFHLVRTSVNRAQPPSAASASIAEIALGLTDPNQPVIPSGSDGVVDWDSMVATAPGSAGPPNSFTLPANFLISHSGPIKLFGSVVGQTDSADVATHVQGALLQDLANPDPKVFGPFQLPPLLPETTRDAIDAWARKVRLVDLIVSNLVSSGLQPAGNSSSYRVTLSAPPGVVITEPVAWVVEVYGTNGVLLDGGVTVQPIAGAPGQAQVNVSSSVIGDVLLHVSFRGQNGTNYLSKPLRIVRREPPGATPVALLVDPTELSLPVGADFPLSLGFQYADGSSRIAFAAPGEIVISGQTNSIVDVSKPQRWRVVGVGTAQLSVRHAGLTAQVTVTGFQPDQPYRVPLEIERSGTNQVSLAWPMGAPGILERAGPELGASWIAATNTSVVSDGKRRVTLSSTNRAEYYRVRP